MNLTRFLPNAQRSGRQTPTLSQDSLGQQLAEPSRTTDYAENVINLASFFLFYVLMLSSAVVVAVFSLREEASFVQSFAVQPLPSLIFAWNGDPASTALPSVSPTPQTGGGQATCTPDYWDRGTRVRYLCTSVAAEARESLEFTLYTTTPFPATFSTYRDADLRYPDIEVQTYSVAFYTYITPTATAFSVACQVVSTQASASTPSVASPTVVQAPAAHAAAATSPPAVLHPRQASGISTSANVATPTSASLSLRKIDYERSSLSALAAGTIVSTLGTPAATTTSIVVYTAKLKTGNYIFFTVVAVIALAFATLTLLLVSYNLAVATKKVWPPAPSLREDQTLIGRQSQLSALGRAEARLGRKSNPGTNAAAKAGDTEAVDNTTGTPTLMSNLGAEPNTSFRRSNKAPVAGHELDNHRKLPELAPPAYQEHDDSVLPLASMLSGQQARTGHEDTIEVVAPFSAVCDDTEDTPKVEEPVSVLSASQLRRIRSNAQELPQTRTDGSRLSLRLAWLILPSYAYLYLWDMALFMLLLILEITAFGLVADPMVDVGKFVRTGGCLGAPVDKDSVYDLQRQLCSTRKFLSAFPVAYSNATPPTTLTRIARDLLIVQISLAALFLTHLAWVITLFRKTHLTRRDGMEPRDHKQGDRLTGRTRLGYIAVAERVGSHGRVTDQVTELLPRHRYV